MPYTRVRSTRPTLTMTLQYLLVRTHTARGYSLLGREADDDTLLHPGDEVAVGSGIPPTRVRYSSYDPVRDVQQVSFGESFNDEMCFLWHYYYPSQGFQVCSYAMVGGSLQHFCK